MVIAYSRAGHNTHHQNSRPSLSAAQPVHPRHTPPPRPTLSPLSSAATRNPSGQTAPGDLMREVAPKAIPKQKVKENEESVWSEMRVLQGLHHLNMVSLISPPRLFSMIRLRTRPRLSPNMFGCLSVGQILRLVRVWDKYDLDLMHGVDGELFRAPQSAWPLPRTRCRSSASALVHRLFFTR